MSILVHRIHAKGAFDWPPQSIKLACRERPVTLIIAFNGYMEGNKAAAYGIAQSAVVVDGLSIIDFMYY